jgi:hypothetical protein
VIGYGFFRAQVGFECIGKKQYGCKHLYPVQTASGAVGYRSFQRMFPASFQPLILQKQEVWTFQKNETMLTNRGLTGCEAQETDGDRIVR